MNIVATIEHRYSRTGRFEVDIPGQRARCEITPDDLTPAEREMWEKFAASANESPEVAHLQAKEWALDNQCQMTDVYLGKLKRYSDALFNIAHGVDSLAEVRSRARRELDATASGDAA